MPQLKLVTLDPGHFHAALVQKEMYEGVSRRASVFAPLGPDLLAHLGRIVKFNTRRENPTAWELEVFASPRFLEEMTGQRAGDIAVIAGRNRAKIDYIERASGAGYHVLADKPWIIRSADLARLEGVLERAAASGLVAYDIMTERYEITSILQRELVRDPAVFGEVVEGSASEPAVSLRSVHHIAKLVADTPLLRPAWFFDVAEQGEALADVGTHLVDLVAWTLASEVELDYRTDIEVLTGEGWPTVLTLEEYRRVTGEPAFADSLERYVRNGRLHYLCNNRVRYRLRGVHVTVEALWNYEAPPGAGDTHFASYQGTRSRIEVRQGEPEGYQPELYVIPCEAGIEEALTRRIAALQRDWPGTGLERREQEFRVTIPDRYRVGHEAHFAQVARQFLRYVRGEEMLPAWEKAAMLAKYLVTTRGVELRAG